jgi:phospholipid transport system substrate-binding protein
MQVSIKQRFMVGIFVLLAFGQRAWPDSGVKDANDPNELLRSKWDAVALVLQKNDINEQAKAEKIDEIITPAFDFELMAKLSLGEKHWPKFNQRQREDFIRLFVEKLRTVYREKISRYDNDVATLKPPLESRKGTAWIPMEVVSQERKVGLLYKLRKADDRWMIYDVEIEGVSVLLTYRAQFDDILSNGTVEDLLTRLAEKQPAQ